jgi:hypothetical protein
MQLIKIIKKDHTLEDYDEQKIITAIQKSARRVMIELSPSEYSQICNNVWQQIEETDEELIEITEIHNMVEAALEEFNPLISKSYRDYRNYKTDFVHMLDEVYNKAQSIMYIGDKDNANTDSALVATKRSLVFNELNKRLYQKFFLTTEELKATKDGYIYIHDMSARRDTMNCCLFDLQTVMSGGFEMGNVWYEEPNSLDTAFDVMGDIILSTAAQQYGGFTVPEVDKTLDPYANKSYKKYIDEFYVISDSLKVFNKDLNKLAKEYALNKIKRDFEQGWQGIEYKLNTVGSSRGDYPFVTMTFGLATTEFGKMAAITFLNVHKEGQGKKGNKKPVLFPKLVFLYDENIHGEGRINEDVFDAGIECSLKTMYPDWLSLTGEGYVPSMYKKYSKVVSPMGCVDGNEIVTYKYKDRLFVESFKRMWNRLSDNFIVKEQFLGNHNNLYISADNLKIYDTEKGFVSVKKVIRNTSDKWFNVKMSHGRSLLCTEDHPFHTGRGRIEAKDLAKGDSIKINPNQYFEENIYFDSDKAWLLGFILCDGCYDGHITSSIAYESEDDIEIKYKERMKKCFGLDTKTVLQERDKKGNYKDLNSYGDNCSNVIDYLSVKFEGLTKNRRHIPNEVFEWDYRAKLNFLAGMIDADGYINPKSHGGRLFKLDLQIKNLHCNKWR